MDDKVRRFKQILESQEHHLDKDQLWQEVFNHLPTPRKRRIGVWLIFLCLASLSISIGLIYSLEWYSELSTNDDFTGDKIQANSNDSELLLNSVKMQTTLNIDHESKYNTDDQAERVESTTSKAANYDVANPATTPYTSALHNHSNTEGNRIKQTDNSRTNFTALSDGNKLSYPSSMSLGLKEKIEISLQNKLPMRTNEIVLPRRELRYLVQPVLSDKPVKYSFLMMSGTHLALPTMNGEFYEHKESGLLGFNTSVLFEYHLKKRWSMRTGLRYAHSVVRYSDQSSEIRIENQEDITEIRIDALGVSNQIIGNTEKTVSVSNDIVWHRRHDLIDFHLSIQKNLFFKNGLRLGLQGGLNYNLFAFSRGYSYDFSEGVKFNKIKLDDKEFYKKSWGIQPTAGLELGYITGRLEWIFNVNIIQNILPINTLNNNYQLKHSQAGIRLGTRYYLQGNKN